MDKATEMMFDIMHWEHMLIMKRLGTSDELTKDIKDTYEKTKKLALKENENAN